jgi:hypothetical protein
MQLLDILIEAEPTDLDWCADPADMERAVARRLPEIEPGECAAVLDEKAARLKLARELERVVQH